MSVKVGEIYYSPLFRTLVKVMDVYGRQRPDGSIHRGIDLLPVVNPLNAPLYSLVSSLAETPTNDIGGNETWLTKNGIQHRYSHQKTRLVVNHEPVVPGQKIGIVGNTGHVVPKPTSTNPNLGTHLHFQKMVWTGKIWKDVDPTSDALDLNQKTMPELESYGTIVANGQPYLIGQDGETTTDQTAFDDKIKFDRMRISKNWPDLAHGFEYRAVQAEGKPIRWMHDNNIKEKETTWGLDSADQKLQDIDSIIHS